MGIRSHFCVTRLFRAEVVAARQSTYLGTIRIGSNPGFLAVTVCALTMAGAVIAYGVWGEIARKARVVGLLVPTSGTIPLSSPQPGTVTDIRVKEGDTVTAQQVLLTVSIDRSTTSGDTAALIAQNLEQRRATLRAERNIVEIQYRQRQDAVADRSRSLEMEIRQAEAGLDSARRRTEFGKKSVERYGELISGGFVAPIQLQQKQEELLDSQAHESTAERSLTSLRRDQQTLRAEQMANASALQAQIIQIDRNIASLSQESNENSGRRELVVAAPKAGIVAALVATPGQLVQAGQTLAVVVPSSVDGKPSPLEAQLFAPSRAAGFVVPGQIVQIKYAAYPYQKFGMAEGTIASVSRTPLVAQDLPIGQGQLLLNATQTNEPTYRVTVSLASQSMRTYGQANALKPGMVLEADIIQERRRIWEWILEPVFAASGLSAAFAGTSK